MKKRSDWINAGGFLLAPLAIMLLWLDLSLPYPVLMAVLFFGLLPLVRMVRPIDLSDELDESALAPWIVSALHWLPSLVAALGLISAATLPWAIDLSSRSAAQMVLTWVSVWIAVSLTQPALHELSHRTHGLEAWLGRLLGASQGLIAFREEHHAHHAKSGKGQDIDCAAPTESVYAFALRATKGAAEAAWDYELANQMREDRPWWSNPIVWMGVVCLGFAGLWLWAQGLPGLLFYALLLVAATFSFRAITFIQHWSLRQVPPTAGGLGVSWVSTCAFQGWVTFNLALHEHHHHNPSRPYWRLRAVDTDLRLPVTYPLCFLLALVPPLYRRVMAPRLAQWIAAIATGAPTAQPEHCVFPARRPPS